jgi:DNA-binding transcriptional LysR family regulator
MKKDQLDGLMTLKVVSETKSFSRAADVLHVSHSAVSQIIKGLEEKMGIALVARTTRSISLTEAGERFLSVVSPAIDQISNAFEDISTFTEKPSGTLRLNLPRSFYQSHFEKVVLSFMKKFPDIKVELCFEEGVSDVVKRGFDAGIRVSDILAKDMVAIKLFGPIRWVVTASPKYLKEKGRPKHPRELINHNCIVFQFEEGRTYDRWEFEKRGEEFQVHVKTSLMMNDNYLLKSAAVNGSGLMYCAEEYVEAEIKSGKLEVVLEEFTASSGGYYLYYPKGSQVLPKLRAFIDHVKEKG